MRSSLKLLIFTLLFLACLVQAGTAFSAVESYSNYTSQQLQTYNSANPFVVADGLLSVPGFSYSTVTNLAVPQNSVSLRLLDNALIQNMTSTGTHYQVTVNIAHYDDPNNPTVVTGTIPYVLNVNYNATPGSTYKAIDTYTFTGAYKIAVTVVSIVCTDAPGLSYTNFVNLLRISADVTFSRQYHILPGQPLTVYAPTTPLNNAGTAADPAARQMTFSWDFFPGIEEYDLEWTTIAEGSDHQGTIDDLKAAGTSTGGIQTVDLDLLFLNNATRVTTSAHSYAISLMYDDNYLVFRLRHVHYENGIRIRGDWVYTYSTGGSSRYNFLYLKPNETNLNWQYSASFAEEGKKKEVINYFDGSLRGRQTVTINNSDNVSVAQENVYDEIGRPIANILPAPFKSNPAADEYLHFTGNLNLHGNAPYTVLNVKGTAGAGCEAIPDMLDTQLGNFGASTYYSTNNADKTGFNAFIPDAGGYPLSVKQYLNDNTGRVSLQGGVGPAFQPGMGTSSKTTKYIYSKPEQWELDQLFGNDVGFAEHYLKNMTIDPNGQLSISYVNSSGKTIATALAGTAPANLDKLTVPNYANPDDASQKVPDLSVHQETVHVLQPAAFAFKASELKLTASTTYAATVPENDVQLNYSIRKIIDQYQGGAFQLCSSCYYNVSVKITDDCGKQVYPDPNNPPAPGLLVFGSQITDANCNDVSTFTPVNIQHINFDHVGAYYISVEFAFDKSVIDYSVNRFVTAAQASGFLQTQYDYIKQHYLNAINVSGCYSDCKTCGVLIGGQADFTTMLRNEFAANGVDLSPAAVNTDFTAWATGLYTTLENQCNALQQSCDMAPCTSYQEQMLQDIAPGGQYALFRADYTAIEPAINVLTSHFSDVFGTGHTLTAAEAQETVTLTDGTVVSPYSNAFTPAMMVQYWKSDWAIKFLQYHPEYCKLQYCQNNSDYESWDEKIKLYISKSADVVNIGKYYHTPNAAATSGLAPYSESVPHLLLSLDPFFNTINGVAGPGTAGTYYNDMLADIDNYSANILHLDASYNLKNLSQYISYQLYCQSTNPNSTEWNNCAPSCHIGDREWAMYRDLYFELKQKYYALIRDATACPGAVCAIGAPIANPLPGSCPTPQAFAIVANGPSATPGMQSVKLVYTGPAFPGQITTVLYFPQTVRPSLLPFVITLSYADAPHTFDIPVDVPPSVIHVRSVDCSINQLSTIKTPFITLTDTFDHMEDYYFETYGGLFNEHVWVDAPNHWNKQVISIVDDQGSPLVLQKDLKVTVNYNYWHLHYYDYSQNGIDVNDPHQVTETYTISAGQSSLTRYYKSVDNNSLEFNRLDFTEMYNPTVSTVSDGYFVTGPPPYVPSAQPMGTVTTCDIYSYKQSRFPQAAALAVATLNSGQQTQISGNASAQLQQQVSDICTGNADQWIAQLKPGLDAIGATADGRSDQLKNKLIETCAAGGDVSHPFGASDLSGSTASASYGSFGAAIQAIIFSNSGYFTTTINPWLISSPAPYTTPQLGAAAPVSKLNAGIYGQIQILLGQYGTSGSTKDFYGYLQDTYGSAMNISAAELTSLVNANPVCNYVLDQDVAVPYFMNPAIHGCLTHSEFETALTALKANFSGNITADPNYPTIVANYMNLKWGYLFSYADYAALDANTSGTLCAAASYTSATPDPYACIKSAVDGALAQGSRDYDAYIAAAKDAYRVHYINSCSLAQAATDLVLNTQSYHYTLYYYDQADNLVRTVSPDGVVLLSQAQQQQADAARIAFANTGTLTGTEVYPNHGLTTNYAFNSTNQAVQQQSPDAGQTTFWYDLLGRVVASQDAKQAGQSYFSYTQYDPLGRAIEVGQKYSGTSPPVNGTGYLEDTEVSTFNAAGINSQVTHTYYDAPATSFPGIPTGLTSITEQNNLRKRISAVTYEENYIMGVTQATYYNYDLDGNVKTLWQHITGLTNFSDITTLKRIDYEYDLISGKVTFVRYQDGKSDQFYYKYGYDAENRVIDAWSGTKAAVDPLGGSLLLSYNKRLDVHYSYYLHGPLARVELGDQLFGKVQGVDYAYTLQGWLKGVNSTNLSHSTDMGQDGVKLSTIHPTDPPTIASDAYGFALHYYGTGDYAQIGGANPFADASAAGAFKPLYNGNITASSLNLTIPQASAAAGVPMLYAYSYDQLSRLTEQDAYTGLNTGSNTWAPVHTDNYQEKVRYTHNGNILRYTRNGTIANGQNLQMDDLTYGYNLNGGLLSNNKLRHVKDAVPDANYSADLDNQADDNYNYDAIGNLIYDYQSGITGNGGQSIDWSVYGKIKTIYKNTGNIAYTYNGSGQRVSKAAGGLTTYYVRDPQGNPLALYDNANNTINWREQHLYGSQRLGMWAPGDWTLAGNKTYELSNHLGNVLATITDRRIQHTADQSTVDYYNPDITNAQDYYPFGSLMPGRTFPAASTGSTGTPVTPPAPPTVSTVYQHSFEAAVAYPYTAAPNILNSNLSGSSWTNSYGAWVTYTGGAASTFALGLGTTTPSSQTTATITLIFNVASGYKLDVKSFSFYSRSTTTGYQNYAMTINGISVGSGALYVDPTGGHNAQGTSTLNVTNTVSGLTGTITVVLTLTNRTGTTGTFKIDNFTLNGYTQAISTGSGTLAGTGKAYRYGFNGKENDDEVKGVGNELDFGGRIYDPRVGRWLSVDPQRMASPGETPYRFGHSNPIQFKDPDGNWEEDGHFWTVYAMGITLGLNKNDARSLAVQAEWYDHIVHRDNSLSLQPIPGKEWMAWGSDGGVGTWADPEWQQTMHGLTGGSQSLLLSNVIAQIAAGNLYQLHTLGDAWAHSYIDENNERSMYGQHGRNEPKYGFAPLGRLVLGDITYEHAMAGPAGAENADKISKRPVEYLSYVENLFDVYNTFFHDKIKGSSGLYIFEYVQRYGKSKEANIYLFQSYIDLKTGKKSFTTQNREFSEKFEGYLRHMGIKHKTSTTATGSANSTYRPTNYNITITQ
jgi:RHS repeat-associated protein